MSQKIFKNSIQGKIYAVISKMKVGEGINKIDFITDIWGKYDEYINDSFRVTFHRVQKMLDQPIKFKTVDGIIKRVL